jgi:hypothetical protein
VFCRHLLTLINVSFAIFLFYFEDNMHFPSSWNFSRAMQNLEAPALCPKWVMNRFPTQRHSWCKVLRKKELGLVEWQWTEKGGSGGYKGLPSRVTQGLPRRFCESLSIEHNCLTLQNFGFNKSDMTTDPIQQIQIFLPGNLFSCFLLLKSHWVT